METNNSIKAKTEEFLDCVDSMEEANVVQVEEEIRPAISVHAMISTVGYQTIRI